jgi:23S rRNA maturation-related 3'-5' exoribonuclease YhaM
VEIRTDTIGSSLLIRDRQFNLLAIDTVEQLKQYMDKQCEEYDAEKLKEEEQRKSAQEEQERAKKEVESLVLKQNEDLDRHITSYLQRLKEKVLSIHIGSAHH